MRWSDDTTKYKRARTGVGFKLVPEKVPIAKPKVSLEQRVVDLFMKSMFKSARVDVDADWNTITSFHVFARKLRKELLKQNLLYRVSVVVQSVDVVKNGTKKIEHRIYLVRLHENEKVIK